MKLGYGWAGVVLSLIACNSTDAGGCSDAAGGGLSAYPNPPPAGGEILPGVVHARMTSQLLESLHAQVPGLLASLMQVEGDRAVYYLAETSMEGFTIRDDCIGDGEPCLEPTHPSSIGLDLGELDRSLSITWLPADASGMPGVRIALTDLELYADITMAAAIDAGLLPVHVACRVQGADGAPIFTVPEVAFEVRVGIDDSGPAPVLTSHVDPGSVSVDIGDPSAAELPIRFTPCDGSELSDLDGDGEPDCTDPACAAYVDEAGNPVDPDCAGTCGLLNLFGGEYSGFILTMVQPLLDELGPMLATTVSDALASVLGGLPPLAFATRLDLASLVGDLLAHVEPVAVAAVASSGLELAGGGLGRGLDVAIDGGIAAPVTARCAAGARPPSLGALLGPPPDYSGFVEVLDDAGEPRFEAYHVALSVSEAMLTQAAWSLFQSGALCFDLDSWDIQRLAGIEISAGLLTSLDSGMTGLADPKAPVRFSIAAAAQPGIRLGADDVTDESPIVELVVNDLAVDVEVFMDGTYLRLAGLTADVGLRLRLERTPDQALEVVLEQPSITDLRQRYNELAPGSDMAALFGIVVDLAMRQVLIGDTTFPVGDAVLAAGSLMDVPLYVRLNAVRRDLGPTSAAFLSVYATLCTEADLADPGDTGCFGGVTDGRALTSTSARLADEGSLYVAPDPRRFPPERWTAVPSGRALLEVGSAPEAPSGQLYQFRVDGGTWSTYRPAPDGLLEVASPLLLLLGPHAIEVRARARTDVTSRGAAVRVPVRIDSRTASSTLAPVEAGQQLAAVPEEIAKAAGCSATPATLLSLLPLAGLAWLRRRGRGRRAIVRIELDM